jgi:hypothetical protein
MKSSDFSPDLTQMQLGDGAAVNGTSTTTTNPYPPSCTCRGEEEDQDDVHAWGPTWTGHHAWTATRQEVEGETYVSLSAPIDGIHTGGDEEEGDKSD